MVRSCNRPDDEDAEESTPWAEQQTWEALQIANASMKTGAKAGRKGGKQYDLVFEDQIDFVTNEVLAGARPGIRSTPCPVESRSGWHTLAHNVTHHVCRARC